MLHNIENRLAHWDQAQNRGPNSGHDLTDSIPYPFLGHESLFYNKSILEIGPGNGRQYDAVRKLPIKSYDICDISIDALNQECFADVGRKHHLTGYKDVVLGDYDLIHFWYVLHHVRKDELSDFFSFLRRNGRAIMFNTPWLGNPMSAYAGDGVSTTYIDMNDVLHACRGLFRIVDIEYKNERSTGYLVIGEGI